MSFYRDLSSCVKLAEIVQRGRGDWNQCIWGLGAPTVSIYGYVTELYLLARRLVPCIFFAVNRNSYRKDWTLDLLPCLPEETCTAYWEMMQSGICGETSGACPYSTQYIHHITPLDPWEKIPDIPPLRQV